MRPPISSHPRGRTPLSGGWLPAVPALAALLPLLAACDGGADTPGPAGEAAAAGTGTASVAADLLASRRAGPMGAEVPVSGEVAGEASFVPPGLPDPAARGLDGPAPGVVDIASLGYDEGASDATARVLEFSDFGCGYCRRFHLETYPTLREEYVATGRVEWKYVPIVLGQFGPSADVAAHAGECAGEQGRFPGMRDRIFERQAEWRRAAQPLELFRAMAREEEVDMERWERCMREEWRGERIRAGTQLAFQAGLRGTPTFLVVGFGPIPGAIPLDLFRQVLDGVLASPPPAAPQPPGG